MRLATLSDAVDALQNVAGTCRNCGCWVQSGINGNIVLVPVTMKYLKITAKPNGDGTFDPDLPQQYNPTIYLVSLRCSSMRCQTDLAVVPVA